MTFYLKGHHLNGYVIEEKVRAHEVIGLGKNGDMFGFYQFDIQLKKVGMSRKDNNLAPILPERIVCKGRSFSPMTLPTPTHLPSPLPTLRHLSPRKNETSKVFISTYLIYPENISSHLKNFLCNLLMEAQTTTMNTN